MRRTCFCVTSASAHTKSCEASTHPSATRTGRRFAPKATNVEVEQRGDSFQVAFDVACQRDEIDFRWRGTISGTAKGEIVFTFEGEAHSTFQKNRIGFCVLHGPSAAGRAWLLETVDGKKSRGRFPKHISPHQPAKNLKAITHEVADGIHARIAFEGDIFEMEDQRNWTDASFKTYCTPLEIPYPVELAKGIERFPRRLTHQPRWRSPRRSAHQQTGPY